MDTIISMNNLASMEKDLGVWWITGRDLMESNRKVVYCYKSMLQYGDAFVQLAHETITSIHKSLVT